LNKIKREKFTKDIGSQVKSQVLGINPKITNCLILRSLISPTVNPNLLLIDFGIDRGYAIK